MNDLSTNESENSALGQQYMKSVLIKLFLHYSNSGDRTRVGSVSHSSFLQLLKDSGMVSDAFSVESADLFIRSRLKQQKTFNFHRFCEAFLVLAEMVFAQESLVNRAEALLRLLTSYVMPLHTSLIGRGLLFNFEISISPPFLQLLSSVHKYLNGLYKLYFTWETCSAQSSVRIQKLSEKSLLSLLHRYKVYPDIITRSLFKSIWENLNECPPDFVSLIPTPSIGRVFTYNKFVAFLTISAAFGTFKHKFDNLHEKFLSLLETMEICSERKEISGGSVVVKNPSRLSSPKKAKKVFRQEIFIIYNYLKYFGNPKEVNFRKLKDLLSNLGIMIENLYEIELIFKTFSKKDVTPEVFSEIFLKISEKITERDDSSDVLLDCILESPWFLNKKNKLTEYIEKISSEDLSQTCQGFEKSLKPFLSLYSRTKLFSFEDLMKFCSDFQLYPELITKARLDDLFYCFCVGENSELLSINSCLLVIEICAVLAFLPDLDDSEKLQSVLRRAIHGSGPGKAAGIKGLNRTSALMKAGNLKGKKKEKKELDVDTLLSQIGTTNKPHNLE
jgi:hypothetical protein